MKGVALIKPKIMAMVAKVKALILSFLAIPKALLQKLKGCKPSAAGMKAGALGLLATFKKYALDIIMNSLLIFSGTIIAFFVAAAVAGSYNALFLICFGAFSNIILMLKNLNMIISPLFEVIDAIETKVNEAIDQLQEDVSEELTKIFGHAAGPVVCQIVSNAIDKAREEVNPKKRLPCPLKKKCYLMTLLGLPLVAFFCYSAYGGIQLILTHTPTTSNTTNTTATNTLSAEEESVDLVAVPGVSQLVALFLMAWKMLKSFYKAHEKTMKPLVRNALFAYLATVPMMCLIVNGVIGTIEKVLNKVLLSLVKGKIPGGVPKLQVDVDRVEEMQAMCKCTVS